MSGTLCEDTQDDPPLPCDTMVLHAVSLRWKTNAHVTSQVQVELTGKIMFLKTKHLKHVTKMLWEGRHVDHIRRAATTFFKKATSVFRIHQFRVRRGQRSETHGTNTEASQKYATHQSYEETCGWTGRGGAHYAVLVYTWLMGAVRHSRHHYLCVFWICWGSRMRHHVMFTHEQVLLRQSSPRRPL